MNYIVENWYVIVGLLVLICAAVAGVLAFVKLGTPAQLAKVQEWLLWAVTEAEKELGGGTGRLKLRQVYDMFLQRFSWLARIVSFERFSQMVDKALEDMRKLLQSNSAVQAYTEGK